MFGNPETTSGGMALKFYASVRMDVRRIQSIKTGQDVVGNRTRVRIVKNKVAAPFQTAEFDIMYNEGVSKSGDLLDLAVAFEIVDKRGSFYNYKEDRLGQGRESAKDYLRDNPRLFEAIEAQIREKVSAAQPPAAFPGEADGDSGDYEAAEAIEQFETVEA
jgi:recombination protein RecA